MSTVLAESEFEKVADAMLQKLDRALNEVSGIEADLQMGVLSICFSDNTKYIVNSHRAAKQIWMAAERAAWHFDYRDGQWIATRNGEELVNAIELVLARKLNGEVKLSR